MEYKEIRKQLRRMAFTEKHYSISKVPRLVAKIRGASSFIFGMTALSFIYSGAYMDALKSALYAVGLYYLGYLRGMLLPAIVIVAELLWISGFFQSSTVVLVSAAFLAIFILYMCYVRFVRDACYVNISGYKRDNEFIEYDDALAQFVPISSYDICLKLDLKISADDELKLLKKYKSVLGVIAEIAKHGFRRDIICAGFISSNDGHNMEIFFYTRESKKEKKTVYLKNIFQKHTELKISLSAVSDPHWEIYSKKLLPDLYERQEIYNINYLKYLERSNIDFEETHKLLYRFKLKSRNELIQFTHELKTLGYEAAKEFPANLVWDDGSIMLVVYKYGRIGQYRINMICKQFIDMASNYNVEFCDWILGGEDGNKY